MFYSKHFFLIARQKKAIKLARLRRNIPVEVIANRSGLGRTTIWAVEKGSPSVAMGAYAKVLHAIEGMDKDLLLICKDNAKGRLMQGAVARNETCSSLIFMQKDNPGIFKPRD